MNLFSSENPDRWHHLTWWLCVITLPWLDMANNICLIFLSLIWVFNDKPYQNWKRLKNVYWIWPFFLYYFILVLGTTYSPDKDNGLFTLDKKITFVVLPLIVATGRTLSAQALSFIKRSFVYSCLLVLLICLAASTFNYISGGTINNFSEAAQLQFYSSVPLSPTFWMNFSYIQFAHWVGFHPAYLSMYLAFSLIILLSESYSSKNEKILHFAFGAVISCCMALLSTRMAIVAFAIAAIFLAVIKIQKNNFKEIASIIVFACLLLFFLLINPVAYFRVIAEPLKTTYRVDQSTLDWNSVNYRLLEWKGSWSIIESHWLAGVGTGGGTNAMSEFYARFNTSTVGLTHNAHNQYLQTWMESGVVGLIAFLFCLFGFLIFKLKLPSSYFAFILIFSLMCMTESIGERQKGVVFFTLFQSLFLGFEAKLK